LAKDLTSEEAQPAGPYRSASSGTETVVGAVMGTPAYMPPEQANGDEVDERADVYAIGAVLYHVLCGEPPHSGTTLEEMIAKVVSGAIVPLDERVPGVPADLVAIVEKAMSADREARYRTAKELAEDLHKFQTGKLVGAHDYSLRERLARWLRRYKLAVGIGVAALAVLAIYGVWSVNKIMVARKEAQEEAKNAMNAMSDAESQRDAANMQSLLVRAQTYARTGHTAEEMAVLRALAAQNSAGERLAIAQGGLLWKAQQRLAIAVGSDPVHTTWAVDGSEVFVTEGRQLVAYDAMTGREQARFEPANKAKFPFLTQVSPTGRFVLQIACLSPAACGHAMMHYGGISVSLTGTLVIDEIATTKRITTLDATASPSTVASASTIAFAVDDSAIAIQRVDDLEILDGTGAVIHRIRVRDCSALAVAPGGAAVATVCKGVLQIWRGDAPPVALPGATPAITQIAFVGTDQLLATGGAFALWDLTRNQLRGVAAMRTARGATDDPQLVWNVTTPDGRRVEELRSAIGEPVVQSEATSLLPSPPRAFDGGVAVTAVDTTWSVVVLR
ncbi:MAG: protein kinase, partial [Polyangiales bacterium]